MYLNLIIEIYTELANTEMCNKPKKKYMFILFFFFYNYF
jgi:hypothetical protein